MIASSTEPINSRTHSTTSCVASRREEDLAEQIIIQVAINALHMFRYSISKTKPAKMVIQDLSHLDRSLCRHIPGIRNLHIHALRAHILLSAGFDPDGKTIDVHFVSSALKKHICVRHNKVLRLDIFATSASSSTRDPWRSK